MSVLAGGGGLRPHHASVFSKRKNEDGRESPVRAIAPVYREDPMIAKDSNQPAESQGTLLHRDAKPRQTHRGNGGSAREAQMAELALRKARMKAQKRLCNYVDFLHEVARDPDAPITYRLRAVWFLMQVSGVARLTASTQDDASDAAAD